MRDGYYAMRKYRAGMIGETIKYWIPGRKPTRSERRLKSDIRKRKSNAFSTVKEYARLLHANFRGGRDILLGLDYSPAGYDQMLNSRVTNLDGYDERDQIWMKANHQLELAVRRTKRACAAEGIPFRYMISTSDMGKELDEKKKWTGNYIPVRVHHHVIINAEALEIFKEKWEMGGVDYETLWERTDQSDLADYILNQVRQIPNAKKYKTSRNLIRPKPQDRIAVSGAELRLPKGATLLYRSQYKPAQAQYRGVLQ